MAKKRRGQRRRNGGEDWINKWCRHRDADLAKVQVYDCENDTVIAEFETVPNALIKAGDQAGEQWLWCLRCSRFFQAKALRRDFLGNWQQCPFDDCGAAGFDIDIYYWEQGLHEPQWPRSVEELSHGLRSAS